MALVFFASLAWVLSEGLKPRPIKLIDPSTFEAAEQVGVVLYRRLRQELRQGINLDLLASSEVTSAARIWNGLIAAAREDGVDVARLYRGPGSPQIKSFSNVEDLPLTGTEAPPSEGWTVRSLNFEAEIKAHNEAPENGPRHLRILLLPLNDSVGHKADCDHYRGAMVSLTDYPCAVEAAWREAKRKKLDQSKIWALVRGHRRDLLLTFVREPGPRPGDSTDL